MTIIGWLLAFIFVIIAIIIHEMAHAWMADRLGDPTAKLEGRLSLNPLAHIDPVGTILMPLILLTLGSPFIFGWAKPVIFDPYNLKNPKRDSALIAMAGPMANFTLAIILTIILRLIYSPFFPYHILIESIKAVIEISVVLAVFNLIPIHPLDGGKIFVGLLPADQAVEADRFLRRYGTLILLFLIFPFHGSSPLFTVIEPVIDFILNILLPSNLIV